MRSWLVRMVLGPSRARALEELTATSIHVEIADVARELAAAHGELSAAAQELAAARREIGGARQEIASLAQTVAAVQAGASSTAEQVAAVRGDIGGAREEIALASQRVAANAELVAAARQELNASSQRIEGQVQLVGAQVGFLKDRVAQQPVALTDVDLARYGAIVQAGYARRAAQIVKGAHAPAARAPEPDPARVLTFDQALARLRELRPELFDTWHKLFEQGARGYYELPLEASCSTWTNEFAWLFKHYVDIYGNGCVLDIGCGPRIVPAYLTSFDPASVSAIEPLELTYQPPFHVQRAVAEFLPWKDDAFDTVISGTSMDHVLSLRTALAEIRRVLKPGGHFINWIASVDGAIAYDERTAQPLDDFHLFQFQLDWALPLFEEYFEVVDVTSFRHIGASFDHCFVLLRKHAS